MMTIVMSMNEYDDDDDDDDNNNNNDGDIYMIVETPLAPSLLTESKGLELVSLGVVLIIIIIHQ